MRFSNRSPKSSFAARLRLFGFFAGVGFLADLRFFGCLLITTTAIACSYHQPIAMEVQNASPAFDRTFMSSVDALMDIRSLETCLEAPIPLGRQFGQMRLAAPLFLFEGSIGVRGG